MTQCSSDGSGLHLEIENQLADHMKVSSLFDLRLVHGTTELMTHKYVRSGLLEEVVTQKRRTCIRREETRIGELVGLQQSSQLWQLLAGGIKASQLLGTRLTEGRCFST